jgi:hypothetical protein
MKFKKTITILLAALVVALSAVIAVSINYSDGKSTTSGRGARASPGGSFYILPYYLIAVFQFLTHQPNII